MKNRGVPLVLVLLALAAGFRTAGQQPPDRPQGAYFGQTPPGLVPEPFAKDLITAGEDAGCCGFARGGTVFLCQKFREGRCRTFIMRRGKGGWSVPELVPFWETMAQNGDFVISSDDKTMLYQVRTDPGSGPLSQIWRVEITETGWGKPSPFPAPVNGQDFESYASDTSVGTLYFFSRRQGGKGRFDLYRSDLKDGVYGDPVNLAPLNTQYDEWDPFIASDGSFLIFCSTKPEGLGRDDLYITFRQSGGGWGPAVNMGPEVNSTGSENRPFVSRDGKYFFFTSTRNGRRDTYWVRTEFLDRFKKAPKRPD
jgi:hypothetical protein